MTTTVAKEIFTLVILLILSVQMPVWIFGKIFIMCLFQEELELIIFWPTSDNCFHGNTFSVVWTCNFVGALQSNPDIDYYHFFAFKMVGNFPNICGAIQLYQCARGSHLLRLAIFFKSGHYISYKITIYN